MHLPLVKSITGTQEAHNVRLGPRSRFVLLPEATGPMVADLSRSGMVAAESRPVCSGNGSRTG